jgi:uncharacterized protein
MPVMKTPGVYIVEKNAFPNSVVEVATAVPAFVGHTQRADNKGKPLAHKPWRISSMAEYHQYFGFAPVPRFEIAPQTDPAQAATFRSGSTDYVFQQLAGVAGGRFLLYLGMLHFFQNGGGACYVVSVGGYTDEVTAGALQAGIDTLTQEQEPTMLVVPDAMLLDLPGCTAVQQAMLGHCGRLRNRIAILDIWAGHLPLQHPSGNCVEQFRNTLGTHHLDFAAAYYPWMNTTLVQDKDLNFENIASADLLVTLLKAELGLPDPTGPAIPSKVQQQAQTIDDICKDWTAGTPTPDAATIAVGKGLLNKSLVAMSPLFNTLLTEAKRQLNLMPPSPAMAGLYTMVDNSRGVWKAPANVSINGVVSPAVTLSSAEQDDLNVTTSGKSVNAIRAFIGEGVLVWGARTLDGNSLDWRYINVRRTMIMLEESIRLAAKACVFEPNVANTWVTIKSMVENFLTGIWKRGGLAGAVPDDAFSVHVGLGETMTPDDVLEGILRVTVLVALTRPAEFIEITFQQQMQTS